MGRLNTVLIVSFLLYSLHQVDSEEYYITANSTDHCISSCLTLTEFVTNFSNLSTPNATVVFGPGVHYLNGSLNVLNSSTFSMTSENMTAQIRCASASHSNMVINWTQNVLITNLDFIGCGGNQLLRVERFVASNVMFRGQGNSRTALQLIETTAQITNCTFLSNRHGQIKFTVYFGYSISQWFGGAIIATHSNVDISQSIFKNNGEQDLNYGGAIYAEQQSVISINTSTFINNSALNDVIFLNGSNITMEQSIFKDNIGDTISLFNRSNAEISVSEFYNNYSPLKGILYLFTSSATIEKSKFDYNLGIIVHLIVNSEIRIATSEFWHNTGSVILSDNSSVSVISSKFDSNTEAGFSLLNQGVVLGSTGGTIVINDSNFTNNISPVIVALSTRIMHYNRLLVTNNSAEDEFATIHLDNSEFIGHRSGNATIADNLRSLVAFNSNVTFMGDIRILNNRQPQISMNNYFQEGGAMTLIQSNAYFDGISSFEHNQAEENGGAILSIESKFYVRGNVSVAHNIANGNGGGMYLMDSELNCLDNSTFVLLNNTAEHRGGGIHAISSSVKITSVIPLSPTLHFINNTAERGGGLSLEANARITTVKYLNEIGPSYYPLYQQSYSAIFLANSATYGGAVYVDDDTNSGTCTIDPKTECFFQVLAYVEGLYTLESMSEYERGVIRQVLKPKSLYFSRNNASISGWTLHGGLLDRCIVNQNAEVRIKYEEAYEDGGNGIDYLNDVSTITDNYNMSVSSQPVKVCLCMDSNEHNCTQLQTHIEVTKGETFTVSLASLDQVNNPVSGLIHTLLRFAESAVASGQATRQIPAKCTNLTFNIVSNYSSEELTLYALDGPCRDVDLSKISLNITFLPCSCPIGLQIQGSNETNCTCECHERINEYVDECDSNTGEFLRKSQSNAWINFTNTTEPSAGFLIYPNCPFDYCNTLNISIDLNQPNGADAQCAFKRSSLLCGSCQPGLSLSLGSSRCLSCPSYWRSILLVVTTAAILAGIALVTLLLILNMTVAIGTLNGLIFFANVVHANKSILFPFQETNFMTLFVSWLNLELGIDVCYFPGMDTFGKTLLQLAFPTYMIFLVAVVIIISSYSSRFSNLIGKKNPVATLSTLILLSYAKLLEVSFKSLSFGNLNYPDGSVKMVWLPDATINYLSGKHIILFLAAVLILLVGLVYTALLFSWQWLLHLPKWRIFKWTRDQRLQMFIETYHKPYTPKHRYWTGLLLLARAILYLVAAVNVSNDPTVALTAIIVVICFIFALKAFTGSRVYRSWPIDVLEVFFYLNIILFTTFTWYCLGECRNKKAAAYISVSITFLVLLLIILYHVYTYTSVFSKIKQMKFVRKSKKLITSAVSKNQKKVNLPLGNDDSHGLHDLLDIIDRPINTNDYTISAKRAGPTFSIVEVHHPKHEPSSNTEESNINSLSEIEVVYNKNVSQNTSTQTL